MTKEPHRCVDCNTPVPDSHSAETSTFTSSIGWRLKVRVDEKGERQPEWRCPRCWAMFKTARRPPP